MQNSKNPKKALRWLILIPIQLILDIILVVIGFMIGMADISGEVTGYTTPVNFAFLIMLAGVITIIVIAFSVIMTCVRYNKLDQEQKKLDEQEKKQIFR